VIVLVFASFLVYQSYMLFVDNRPEYPWFQKKIAWFETPPFYSGEVITFGFPYYRAWKEVNDIIPKHCNYLTNEDKSISQIYVEAKYGNTRDCRYIVRIRDPFYLDGAKVVFPGLTVSSDLGKICSIPSGVVSKV
jgi:hypothetical protein